MTKPNRLRPDHWALIHAKLAMITWAIFFLCFTPNLVAFTLEAVLVILISSAVIIGAIISLAGLFWALTKKTIRIRSGENLELVGLWMMLSGPVAYFVTQLYLSFGPEGDQRVALTAFAYALSSFVLVRITIVTMHRNRVSQ